MLLLTSAVLNSQEIEEKGTLSVDVEDFRSDKGGVGILLFDGKSGFPGDKDKAYRVYYSTLQKVSYSMVFEEVKYGTYAVTAFHDENFNRKLDTNWLGIPTEGVGVSGEIRGFLGPRFRDSSFFLNKSTYDLRINMKYLR